MLNTRIRPFIVLWLLLAAGMVYGQDSTPEATPELTPEVTPTQLAFPGTGGYTLRGNLGRFERVYNVYIPETYAESAAPLPLLFVFHGAGGNGAGIAEISAFNDLADTEGIIVVYPDGINRIWNDGRPPDANIGIVDDVGFVKAMLATLSGSLNIDTSRVYAAGFSAGGMFSFRLACDMPDQIAAIASVASTFPEYLRNDCEGKPPVPVLVIQGTDDPIIPWMGMAGGYLSAAATLDYWGAHNGCATPTAITLQDDADPEDGTRVLTQGHIDCDDGADVQLYSIFFGGHTWPSHPIRAPFELGITSNDIDATLVIWEFFKRHSLA